MEVKTLTREEKLAKLRNLAKAELDLCDKNKTPYVCALNNDSETVGDLLNTIVKMVQRYGLTIGQCIVRLERDYNPNLIND